MKRRCNVDWTIPYFLAVAVTFGASCESRSSIAFEIALLLAIVEAFEVEESIWWRQCIECRNALSVGLHYLKELCQRIGEGAK